MTNQIVLIYWWSESETIWGTIMTIDNATLKKLSSITKIDDWITFIIKSSASPQKKGYLTKIWLENNGLTKKELDEAKKYNKLWKDRASKNTLLRRRKLEIPKNLKKAGKPWTEQELQKLKENINQPEAILIKMFKRSLQSINSKKRIIRMKMLGIDTQNTGKPWSKKEVKKLERFIHEPNMKLAKMLKRSTQSIQGKKKELRNLVR